MPPLPERLPETCPKCGGWVWHRTTACECGREFDRLKAQKDEMVRRELLAGMEAQIPSAEDIAQAADSYAREKVLPNFLDSFVAGAAKTAFIAGARYAMNPCETDGHLWRSADMEPISPERLSYCDVCGVEYPGV